MTTIYLIRHAEAEGNLYRRIHGWYDALITENGFAQIEALQRRFRDIHIDAVWSSDLYRTMTTARAIYVPKGLELHTDPQLRELNFGDWEDRPWGQVYHDDPDCIGQFNRTDPTWRAPGGESLAEAGRAGGRRPAPHRPGPSGSDGGRLLPRHRHPAVAGQHQGPVPPGVAQYGPQRKHRRHLPGLWTGSRSRSSFESDASHLTRGASPPWPGRPGGGRRGGAGRM